LSVSVTNFEIFDSVEVKDTDESVNGSSRLCKQVTPGVVKLCRQIAEYEADAQHQVLHGTQQITQSATITQNCCYRY